MHFFKIVISEFLHVFGLLWLVVEATRFFATPEAAEKAKSYWWVFLIIGIVLCFYRIIPKKRFSFKRFKYF